MLRTNNSTTILLVIIVIILLMGVGIAIYYVLDLDWIKFEPIKIYTEVPIQPQIQIKVEKEIKYDTTKRTYNIVLDTEYLKVVVYRDGTVGVTMAENEKYSDLANYNELLNKESKLELTNIVRAYNVVVSKEANLNNYIVLLDSEGNLHKLVEDELSSAGKYTFVKIDGLAKIIDIRQITNDGLTENVEGINAIAIDEESNELLLTNYLVDDESLKDAQP